MLYEFGSIEKLPKQSRVIIWLRNTWVKHYNWIIFFLCSVSQFWKVMQMGINYIQLWCAMIKRAKINNGLRMGISQVLKIRTSLIKHVCNNVLTKDAFSAFNLSSMCITSILSFIFPFKVFLLILSSMFHMKLKMALLAFLIKLFSKMWK